MDNFYDITQSSMTPSTDENETIPEGWTKMDKYDLLQALKMYGAQNADQIQMMLPNKSPEQIEEMLNFYREKAMKHPKVIEKSKDKTVVNNISRVPLAMWAKFLTDSLNYKELQTETASAVRLIADFEGIPTPLCTGNVNFRLVYHAIANALEGKTIPDDPVVNSLLEKCIVETAYTSKSFIRNSTLRHVLDSINLSDKEISVFPRPTNNNELATVRHLASQRNYNPLNISEEYLKSSIHN